ncbi:MAG: pyruvate ferredoxin oxidoreductase, partial [Proteobacteria bacterium]|nr:pyruvate ferredoxin oxidoreductase [Pseudomonadota bacterium]
LAKKKVGIVQAMNTVVLGALTYLMPFADQRLMRTSLKQSLPPKIQEVNVKAFNLGYREAKRVFGADGVNWTGKAEEVDGHEDI